MVAYDISNDRIRREIRKILNNHGSWVQYSVFECNLKDTRQDKLQIQLAALIEADDSIRWYPICDWCRKKLLVQGKGNHTDFPDYYLL